MQPIPNLGVTEVVIILGVACLCLLLIGGLAALFVWVSRRNQ